MRFRPVVPAALAFACGVAVGTSAWVAPFLLFVSIVCLIASMFAQRESLTFCGLLCAFAAAGGLRQSAQSIPGRRDVSRYALGGYVELIGRVAAEPIVDRYYAHLHVEPEQVKLADGLVRKVSGRVLVRAALGDGHRVPTYGERVALKGMLRPLQGPGNPGAGMPLAVLHRQGVFSSMECRGPSTWRVLSHAPGLLDRFVALALSLRRSMNSAFGRCLPTEQATLLTGLVLGGHSDLSSDVREQFRRSGILHIVAASGANVGMVVAVVFLLAHVFPIPPSVRAWLAVGAAIVYAVAAGSQPAVVRAATMACVFMAAPIFGRERDAPCALAAAALAALAYDPANLYDVGFQLSFAIVVGTIAYWPVYERLLDRVVPPPDPTSKVSGRVVRVVRGWANVVALSAIAGAFSAPLTAQVFNAVPILGVVSNALIAPAVGVLMPAAIIGWAAQLAWPVLGNLVCVLLLRPLAGWIMAVAGGIASLDYASVNVPSPGWPMVAALYVALGYGALKGYARLVRSQ